MLSDSMGFKRCENCDNQAMIKTDTDNYFCYDCVFKLKWLPCHSCSYYTKEKHGKCLACQDWEFTEQ